MSLFRRDHEQGPAGSSDSKLIAGLRKGLGRLLGKKGRQAWSDTGSIIPTSDSSQARQERSENGLVSPAPNSCPPAIRKDLPATHSLWQRAYATLRKDEEKLIKGYEKLLLKEAQVASTYSRHCEAIHRRYSPNYRFRVKGRGAYAGHVGVDNHTGATANGRKNKIHHRRP
jgi:hypothetical protein